MCHLCEAHDKPPAPCKRKAKAKPSPRKTRAKQRKPAKRLAKRAARQPSTHETYVAAIYSLAARAPGLTDIDRATIGAIKLTYGAGPSGARGVTYFNRWQLPLPGIQTSHLVAINALAQESPLQVCGTTLHELGHVLAGPQAGHGADWHAACARLGLGDLEQGCTGIEAAGTEYVWDMFTPGIRAALQALPLPGDGQPQPPNYGPQGTPQPGQPAPRTSPRPCGMGIGSRGGTSRGAGAGSRYIKYECTGCAKPVVLRHAGLELAAKCLSCNTNFTHDPDSIPASSKNGAIRHAPGTLVRATPSKHATRTTGKRKPKPSPAQLKAAAKAQAPIAAKPKPKPSKSPALKPGPVPPANPTDPDIPF